MPGDEKRGRPPEDTANGAPGGAARSKDRAHKRTGSASWRAAPFTLSQAAK